VYSPGLYVRFRKFAQMLRNYVRVCGHDTKLAALFADAPEATDTRVFRPLTLTCRSISISDAHDHEQVTLAALVTAAFC
jgi:hypothetical protein